MRSGPHPGSLPCGEGGGGFAFAVVLGALASSAALADSGLRQNGVAVAVVSIAADGTSAPVAVNVGRIAKETFAADSDVTLLDMERVMDGADPVWLDKIAQAEAAVKKGKTAKDSVELPIAADAFAEAVVAYEQAVPGMKDMNAVVDVLVQQGTVFVLQGDPRAGQQAFQRALALDPAVRLPKDGSNKRVLATFDAAIKEQKGAGQGTLTVYATTGAAEVWVDGVFRGVAPFSVDVGAGRHYVRVVRDGYLSFGSSAEVKRGSEASVQASLRPTAKLAKLEELSVRIAREPESDKPIADLAAALQVDRLIAIVVRDENGSALLTAAMIDGVSGKVLARANKAFASKDNFFDHDVRSFLEERVKNGDRSGSTPDVAEVKKRPPDDTSLLPGAPEKVETPGAVVGGWVLVGVSGALFVNTAICGTISYTLYDDYRNKLTSQLDTRLNSVRSAWFTMSAVTDASWILGTAAAVGGTVALLNGYAQQRAQEEIVNP